MNLCSSKLHDTDVMGRRPNGKCAECSRLLNKAYYESNKRKWQEQTRSYHQRNKEGRRQYIGRYRAANQNKWREASQRRRSLLQNTVVEKFKEQDIFERDGWICQLCYKPVDPQLKHPNPLSTSIHHVIPLSRGGPHTSDNVVLAHLVCNMQRWATVDSE